MHVLVNVGVLLLHSVELIPFLAGSTWAPFYM